MDECGQFDECGQLGQFDEWGQWGGMWSMGLKKATPKKIGVACASHQGLEPWTYGLTVRRSNQLS